MKLSEMPKEQLLQFPVERIERILYHGLEDRGESADVALLLGTTPELDCKGRALQAAKLYLAGRVNCVIPSGGVEHSFPCGDCTEAEYMEKTLLEAGVPQSAILLENEARTTKENMVCGVFQITRKLLIQNVKSVMIVTSAVHMRRSLALAALFMPRSIRVTFSAAPDTPEGTQWWELERLRQDAIRELQLMQDLIRQGLMDDIECE